MQGHVQRAQRAKPKPGRGKLTIKVRDGTRAKLKAMADRNGRSMSEELEMLLEQRFALAQWLGFDPEPERDRMRALVGLPSVEEMRDKDGLR